MTAKRFEILALGHCCVDLIYQIDNFLVEDGKTEATIFDMQPGGPAANAVVAAARLGAKCAFLGQAGNDLFGDFIRQAFLAEGIEFQSAKIGTSQTRIASCLVHAYTGNRQVYVNSIPPLDWNIRIDNLVSEYKLLLLDGHEMPLAKIAVKDAVEKGIPIVLGAGSLRPGMKKLISHAEVTIASEKFTQSYSPGTPPEQVARMLYSAGTKIAIVTRGAYGSVGFDGTNIYHIPAFKVNVVDTTGAGDAYLGAFCFAFLQDWTLPEKMKFATFIAAEKCKHLGGRRGLPHRTEVKKKFAI